MGSIIERRRKDGTSAFLAQVSIMREGRVYRETKTFDRRPAAKAWIEKREKSLSKSGPLGPPKATPLLRHSIDQYIAESRKLLGKTKAQVLAALKADEIADKLCSDVTSQDLVDLAHRLGQTRQPQTVMNYLSHLSSVFAIARPAWGHELDPAAMADALKVAKRLGLVSKSRQRDRRPTLDELDKLLTFFTTRSHRHPRSAPMAALIVFAIFSTRRQEEITQLRWADLDEVHDTIIVRDMKNPGEKIGNDVRCDVPPEAMRVIATRPRAGDLIWPYSADAISAAFTRTCKVLGIENLHFHDLRHDGISRLFEMKWTIPHVAAVSGHRSWQSLQRYTHLRHVGDKYAGWKWLDTIAPTKKSV